MVYTDFNNCYRDLLELVLSGDKVGDTLERNNVKFTITDIDTCINSIRNQSIPYMCGELLWYLRGSNDKKFIGKFGELWNRISDDGLTSNSAYGYIIKYKHGFNQLEKVIELLSKDKNSRRAVININVPNPNVIETKDEMCTIALQFLIRDDKLHCTTMMRSNDIWYGLPYDIIFFTTCQKIIADRLNIKCGTYTHFATSLHIYLRDIEKAEKALEYTPLVTIFFNYKNLLENVNELYDMIDKSDNPKEDIITLFSRYDIIHYVKREEI